MKRKKRKGKDKPFYLKDIKWTKLRQRVFSLYGRTCMKCGILPENIIDHHVDHIYPKSKYPKLAYDINNLQVLCNDCNVEKSNYNTRDYRTEAQLKKLNENLVKIDSKKPIKEDWKKIKLKRKKVKLEKIKLKKEENHRFKLYVADLQEGFNRAMGF